MIARVAAVASLAVAIVLVVLLLLSGGSPYTLQRDFQDAGGLVTGDDVMIGPAKVGRSSRSVAHAERRGAGHDRDRLGRGADARRHGGSDLRELAVGDRQPLRRARARRRRARRRSRAAARSPRTTRTRSSASTSCSTRSIRTRGPGLRSFIQGEAASIQGKAAAGQSDAPVPRPGAREHQQCDRRARPQRAGVRQAAGRRARRRCRRSASRAQQLTELVANTNTTTGAIASQSDSARAGAALLPGTLTHSTATFAGLRTDARRARAAGGQVEAGSSRRLEPFASSWATFTTAAIPTIERAQRPDPQPHRHRRSDHAAEQTPALAQARRTGFPRLIKAMNDSQTQLDYLREYTPDVVAALAELGQIERLLRRQRPLRPHAAVLRRFRDGRRPTS